MDAAAAHVFVADLTVLALESSDAHHLGRALRLRSGEVVTASDGQGSWRRCTWDGTGLVAAGPIVVPAAPAVAITIGFTPVKGDRPEWTVQKLTELGVDRIVVLQTERSVVRWTGGRGSAQIERLARVAREAAMQSRRSRLPVIEGPCPLGAVEGALAHFDGTPVSASTPTVLIGPEGGWSPSELAAVRPHVSLGPTVLRAETAALAAAVLLTAARPA